MPSSHRVGRRIQLADAHTMVSESDILRSLFELRNRCNNHLFVSSPPEVTEITFWRCQWTRRIINSLRKLIVRDGHRFSTIKFFDCEVTNPNFAEIILMLLRCNAATKLVLKARKLVDNRDQRNGEQIPPCESTSNFPSLENAVLLAIRDGLSVNTSLKYLQISGMNFTDTTTTTSRNDIPENNHVMNNLDKNAKFWCDILNSNKTMVHLNLSGSHLSESNKSGLCSALILNTTLESLNFGRCYLDDQSLAAILNSVKNHPTLMRLDVSRNYLAKSASMNAIDAVAQLLRSKKSKLRCIDLSYQQQPRPRTNSSNVDDDTEEISRREYRNAFEDALNALSTNTTLRRIDLSGNSRCFSDMSCVEALTLCLATNPVLSHIDISGCDLCPIGFQYLSQNCVSRCGRNLKSLVLFDGESNNTLVTKNENWRTIFSMLERGLQSNSTLESLGDFGNVGIDSKSRRSLQYLLNLNRAGRRAFQIDDLSLGAWPNVMARACRIEYDTYEKKADNIDCSKTSERSSSRIISASALFEFLHGPAILLDSKPRKQ
mmetsp:Transcript_25768/g.60409  ORF Transcript_25768/g.60409 Transcript_25768/m.60409 type:complete len:546 (-) Transcript_25768:455-2092(-)